MSRYGHAVALGGSSRYRRIEVRVVVDDDGQITLAMRAGDGRLQTHMTPGQAMELAAILENASRVADG